MFLGKNTIFSAGNCSIEGSEIDDARERGGISTSVSLTRQKRLGAWIQMAGEDKVKGTDAGGLVYVRVEVYENSFDYF